MKNLWLGVFMFGYILFFLNIFRSAAQGSCTFPPLIRGTWVRGRDAKFLTFSGSEVTGLDINYNTNDLGNFSCFMSLDDVFVLASSIYPTTLEDKRYYMCWKLTQVTSSSFILYELSDVISDQSYQAQPGVIDSNGGSSLPMSRVCLKDAMTQPFTTLIKHGATYSSMLTPCPVEVRARYSYYLCPQTELDICGDPGKVTANYSICPTKIFNSESGVLYCMGYVSRGSTIYLNLVRPETGVPVTCVKLQSASSGTISVQYYSGDCTTTGTILTLLKIQDCSPLKNSNIETQIIAGVLAGVFVLGGALLLVWLVIRQKKAGSVSAFQNNITTEQKEEVKNGDLKQVEVQPAKQTYTEPKKQTE